jgi:hypothetical protein
VYDSAYESPYDAVHDFHTKGPSIYTYIYDFPYESPYDLLQIGWRSESPYDKKI